MKVKSIILLVILSLCVAAIVFVYGQSSSYEVFETAKANPGKTYHIAGTFVKEKPKLYDKEKDPNFFSFFMRDSVGGECQVVLHQPEPQDFGKSDRVVVVGSYKNNVFDASSILLKCPSKYADEKSVDALKE